MDDQLTLNDRLRDTAHNFALSVCTEAANELDRLSADNVALRQERDSLAATVDAIKRFIDQYEYWRGAWESAKFFQIIQDPTAILAARDARTKAAALREAIDQFDKWKRPFTLAELRRMADAIEKSAK